MNSGVTPSTEAITVTFQMTLRQHCGYVFNTSNASIIAQIAFPNATFHQFLPLCVRYYHPGSSLSPFLFIPYAVIFLLSVVGNSLVILTMVRNKKMRTITNMLLLNLAVSDLLLAVFCMPFTLVPLMMEAFIFGPVICVMLRYLQAVSVAVSCYTLVVISVERFYAICQPLRSRRWQTLKHSYRVLLAIWIFSLLLMVPIAVFTKVILLQSGSYACREVWPQHFMESLYSIVLLLLLFAMPLVLMGVSYSLVARQLWSTAQFVVGSSPTSENSDHMRCDSKDGETPTSLMLQSPMILRRHDVTTAVYVHPDQSCSSVSRSTATGNGSSRTPDSASVTMRTLRPVYYQRVLTNKKRVIKMLCVIVLEYFVCWGPLYALNTWTGLDYMSVRLHVTMSQKAAILLLAYFSSCVHPITYCFMNKRFRLSFADAFRCCFKNEGRIRLHSEGSQAMMMLQTSGFKNKRNGIIQ